MVNTRFEQIKNIAKGTAGVLVAWFRRYRTWIYGGLTVVSILLIVWARFGFTLELGRFYASQCPEDADMECADGGGGGTLPATQTREEIGGCGVAHPTENCCLDKGDKTCSAGNVFQHYESGTNWAGCNGEIVQTCEFGCEGSPNATCKTEPVQESQTQEQTGQQQEQQQSEEQTQQQVAAATGTESETQSTEQELFPLECAPAEQAVGIEQEATFEADGGSGDYEWFVAETGMDMPESGNTFTFSYDSPGAYEVTVNDGTTVSTCILSVIREEEQISCTADVRQCGDGSFVGRIPPSCQFEACPGGVPATTGLLLSGEIRNFTENGAYETSATSRPAQEIQVRAAFFPQGSVGEVRNAVLRTVLPDTVTYIPGTTAIGGQPTSVDTIAAGGLALGSFAGEADVSFRVRVGESGQLPSGTLTSPIGLSAQGDNVRQVTDTVTLIIDNGPTVAHVSEVPTGPDDVMLLALMAAALLTLLYVSYTYTHLYRSREVGSITRRKNPLNFK